jgi:hypothetical protein
MRQAVGDKLRDGMTRLDLLFINSAGVGSCCAATNLLKAKNSRAVMPPFNRCSSGSISAASLTSFLPRPSRPFGSPDPGLQAVGKVPRANSARIGSSSALPARSSMYAVRILRCVLHLCNCPSGHCTKGHVTDTDQAVRHYARPCLGQFNSLIWLKRSRVRTR